MMARRNREDGMSAVLIAFCLVILLGFAALAIESGYLYTVRVQAQSAADAAALSAVRALQSCDADGADRNAAIDAARSSTAANKVDGIALELADEDVTFGRYYPYGGGQEQQFVETNSNPNSVRVVVHRDSVRNGPVQLVLARLIGVDEVGVAAGAIASRDRRVVGFDPPEGSAGNLIPFAGRASSIGPVGSTVLFFSGASQSAPGNWGLMDLDTDGTGFQVGISNGQNVINEQIGEGYTGEATIDPDSGTNGSGRPGTLGGSIGDALESRIGDTVMIAVYDSVSGSGTNSVYHLVGFVPVRIDLVVSTGPLSLRGITATVVEAADSTSVTDPQAEENCLISKVVLAG